MKIIITCLGVILFFSAYAQEYVTSDKFKTSGASREEVQNSYRWNGKKYKEIKGREEGEPIQAYLPK
jgi:hypothetical protein